VKDASKDWETIKRWLNPDEYINVGIATGAESGFFVLDIDPRHDGDETIFNLQTQHGYLPDTVRFQTGGGGKHILFQYPGIHIPNSAGKIGKGIDVRGDGGYQRPISKIVWAALAVFLLKNTSMRRRPST
jgi:hypothetical protein